MSNGFRFLIRDGLESDVAACLALDSTYETEYVWQMSVLQDGDRWGVIFQTERLPRLLEATHVMQEQRLRLALPDQQCFLVAVGRGEIETVLGCLVMRHDPSRQIAWVQDVVVAPPFRRRRIGTRLLNVARQWAVEHHAGRLMVETHTRNYPAILFCQSFGLAFCGFNDQYFANQDIAIFFGQTLR